MKAVILAAGEGNRLRKAAGIQHKVMELYSGKPLLQRTIEILKSKGITKIILVVNYKKESIMRHFSDGKKFGVEITYVVQENPAGGTADAVGYAKPFINDKFLLVYGDNIFSPEALDKLLYTKYDGAMCAKEVENPRSYGVLEVENDQIKRIWEKAENPPSNLALTGLFVLPKDIFDAINKTTLSSRGELELTDSINILISEGKNIGYIKLKVWFDPRNREEIDTAKASLSL